MNSVARNSEIEDTAAAWVLRLDRGDISEDEQRELETWLEADTRHRGEFVRAQAMWVDLDRVAALHAGRAPLEPPAERSPYLRAASFAGAVLAAGVVLALGVNTYLSGRETTDVGEVRRITLDDGSAVALNTASLLQVQFRADERRVVLRRGEASFQVAHDVERPFVVQARDVSVRAVGTAFTVRVLESAVAVTVSEGVVEVVRDAEASGATDKTRAGRNREVVAAAEQPLAAAPLEEKEVARRLSWEQGRLVFDGDRLDDAVEEVNRYSAVRVVIDDPALRGKSFVGVFRTGDARAFASAAAVAFEVPLREEDGALHLGD